MDELVRDLRTALQAGTPLLHRLCQYPPIDAKRALGFSIAPHLSPTLFLQSQKLFGGIEDYNIQTLCERLTLFTLLARLDLQAWRDQVVNTWPSIQDTADEALRTGKPFRFGVAVSVLEIQLLRSTLSSRRMSASYKNFVKRTANQVGQAFVRTLSPIPVLFEAMVSTSIYWDGPLDKRLQFEMQMLLSLVKSMRGSTYYRGASAQVFSVVELYVYRKVEFPASIETLEYLKKLAEFGIEIPLLPAFKSQHRTRALTCLQSLLFPRSSVTSVVIADKAPIDSIKAIASAVVCNQSASRIIVNGQARFGGAPASDFWRWVGFAIATREDRRVNRTWEIQLDPRVDVEDVEALRSMVEAKDPFEALICEARDPKTDHVVVSAKRFYFDAPSRFSVPDMTPDFSSRSRLAVRGIKKLENGYMVLLAGYGKAYVRAQDVERVECKPINPVLSSEPDIDVITHVLESSIPAVSGFFNVLGHRIKKIKILSASEEVGDRIEALLRQIIASCPQIHEIYLGTTDFRDLSIFITTPNATKLHKLTVWNFVNMTTDMHPATVLVEALIDPKHPLARNLKELQLRIMVGENTYKTFLELVRRLLSGNRTLHTVVVSVRPRQCHRGIREDIEWKLNQYHARENALFVRPIPSDSKLAALAAFSRTNAACQLDSSVLAIIFVFAGDFQPRILRLSVDCDYHEYKHEYGIEDSDEERYLEDEYSDYDHDY